MLCVNDDDDDNGSISVYSLDLSADGPQTAELVTRQFQMVAEDVFVWSLGPKHTVNPPLNRT